MDVSLETTSGLERKMTVTIEANLIEGEVNKRIENTSRKAKIDGFRPGKIPRNVIVKRYGDGIRQEVLGEFVQRYFYQAAVQEKVKPVGAPQFDLKQNETGKDVEFVATFEVYPEVTVNSFESIEVEKPAAKVEATDVEKMLSKLQDQYAHWHEVDRAAQDNDQVVIDFEGTIDDEPFEGGKAEKHELILGSKQMIPGFEEQLVGIKAEENRDIEVTFPEDYQAEALAGKKAVFKIKAHTVKEKQLLELKDLAKEMKIADGDEEQFKKDVEANMIRELEEAISNRVKDNVMEGLLLVNEFDVPKAAIDSEIVNMQKNMIAQYGGNESMMSQLPREMFEEQATKRVKLGILMSAIVEKKEITADAESVTEKLGKLASTYQDPEAFIQYYRSNKEHLAQIEQLVLEDKVIEAVIADASISEKESSFDEIMNPKAA